MSNLKIGQRVVCIDGESWHQKKKFLGIIPWKKNMPGPKTGDILKITGFNPSGYLRFKGWDHIGGYESTYFRPLDEDFAEETLKNITKQVRAEEEALKSIAEIEEVLTETE